ncbi:MAG: hypothetical protein NVSMB47_14460 [Polyangiales bacterium]
MAQGSLDDEALRAFLDLAYDFACTRPLSDFVDPAKVLPALDAALTPERIAEAQTRIGAPVRERLLARADQSKLTLAAWLPEPVAAKLAERLGKPAPLPQAMIDDLVGSEKVRDAVRTMLNESLTSFVSKATGGDSTAGAGLRGAFGFAKAAGKGLLGGLGEELQKRMQEKVKDFVDSSVATLQKRIAERLSSEETARALGQKRRGAFEKLLQTTEPRAAKSIRKADPAAADRDLPAIVAHNLARPPVREAIEAEVAAIVAELSKETLGEHLDRAGLRTLARDALHAHGGPFARALVATPAFAAWWKAHAG